MTPFTLYPLCDACLSLRFGEGVDPAVSERVVAAYRTLKGDPELKKAGVVDFTPAYCELALHLDPERADSTRIRKRVRRLLGRTGAAVAARPGRLHLLPVRYDGPDLSRVAQLTGLTEGDVVRLHAAPDYRVAMVGFLEHFPYLLGLPAGLTAPRLDSPRKRVPAGSVGLAGRQTGVYPSASPGGWNLIGRTDPALLVPIRAGDRVRFKEESRL